MRDKYLMYLVISYVLVIGSYFILSEMNAALHSFVLAILFTMVLMVHILVGWRAKPTKLFYILSFLWGIKLIIFVTGEGLALFLRKTSLQLYMADLFMFLVIAFLASVSLILKKPFGYKKTENKIWILFGVIGLIFSSWLTLAASHLFINFEIWRY